MERRDLPARQPLKHSRWMSCAATRRLLHVERLESRLLLAAHQTSDYADVSAQWFGEASHVATGSAAAPTANTPVQANEQHGWIVRLTPEALTRVGSLDDAVALAETNEVEGLCAGLSRKIWQKIMILQTLPDANE